uniref:Uncharacterized protein n=1 Tax=Anguilla anguilla TaxID=7936 RepID=A0A0E9V2R2_ANGAN
MLGLSLNPPEGVYLCVQ